MPQRLKYDSTDSCYQLDVRKLQSQGWLSCRHELPYPYVTLRPFDNHLVARHENGVEYTILLLRESMPTGGYRMRVGCPCCGRSAAILYWRNGGVLACRICYKLRHKSAQASRLDRAALAVSKLFRKLGGHRDFTSIHQAPPPKPRGMWVATYRKLCREIEQQEQRYTDTLLSLEREWHDRHLYDSGCS